MRIITVLLALSMVAGSAPAVFADDDKDRDKQDKFEAKLSGYDEVIFATTTICVPGGTTPPPPCTPPDISVVNTAALRGAVSTTGSGKFELKIESDSLISYKLSYKNLEGAITQAHIHFGQRFTPGGIVLFLCANPPVVPPTGTPLCPGIVGTTTPEGIVTGTLEPADVIAGAAAQGIALGEFAEVLRAIRNDATYANVHTSLHPQGEIRCHIEPDGDRHGKRDHHRHHRH
jgi:CHRD domain